MFTPRRMRRARQKLSDEEVKRILTENTSGVLSVIDKDGYPYSVPLSFVYIYNKIFFHSAKEGHKIEAVENNDKASFCIIDADDVKPEKFLTNYKSVIVFGKVKVVDDENVKALAIDAIAEKYYPNHPSEKQREIDNFKDSFAIIELDAEHISGKQGIELVVREQTV